MNTKQATNAARAIVKQLDLVLAQAFAGFQLSPIVADASRWSKTELLATCDPKVNIAIKRDNDVDSISISVAFLQRPGVWHDLGNFSTRLYADADAKRVFDEYGLKNWNGSFSQFTVMDDMDEWAISHIISAGQELAEKFAPVAA